MGGGWENDPSARVDGELWQWSWQCTGCIEQKEGKKEGGAERLQVQDRLCFRQNAQKKGSTKKQYEKDLASPLCVPFRLYRPFFEIGSCPEETTVRLEI